ncbi:MAG: AbrB family transcriptional regulator [Alkaliphilus sp.]|nr:MAG: AbrB family transcriptional regulator [Alkaliphilus sp.]
MLTEFRKKSQITIPKDVVVKLGLKEGDKLEITERDGMIRIIPVVVYSKKYLAELNKEIANIKAKTESSDHLIFDNVEELFERLDSEDM